MKLHRSLRITRFEEWWWIMTFIRKVANSDLLASIIDIPENFRNKKVEILIFPYENMNSEDAASHQPKRARGLLEKYKNKELQGLENNAWVNAVDDKYEFTELQFL
jgi:hypothetical protein